MKYDKNLEIIERFEIKLLDDLQSLAKVLLYTYKWVNFFLFLLYSFYAAVFLLVEVFSTNK